MTYQELIRELFPRLTGGIRWGLERTAQLLATVGNPHNAFRSIHIGGTNGKGSVAATVASILQHDRRRVGLYTSPHLCTFRERIQIDGHAISEDELVAAARRLWPGIQQLNASFFEATTAMGFLALAEAGVEFGVIEVGLGGRLDSTNVISPELSIITNIALDHAEYLGNTIESVAREKAGIIKPGVPLFTAETAAEPLKVFAERAGSLLVTIKRPTRVAFDTSGTRFELDGAEYRTPLVGYHQALNVALAIQALAGLGADAPDPAAVQTGVAQTSWPGRLQFERINQQTWVFDVAHNVAGVHALVDCMKRLELPRPLVLVIGILGDKDWRAMLPPLFDLAETSILTVPPTAPTNRAWQPERVLATVPDGDAVVEVDFTNALARAAELARGGTVLVTGSFHTVGDALIVLGRAPFGSETALPRLTFSG